MAHAGWAVVACPTCGAAVSARTGGRLAMHREPYRSEQEPGLALCPRLFL